MDKYRILVKGIVKKGDQYLIVRKWYDDRIAQPYQWGFIDGAIEFGEDPDKAVLRLIGEQTFLTTTIDRILYTWTFTTGDTFNIGISYLCITTELDTVQLSEELVDYRWIERKDFEQYIDQKILNDIERVGLP
ncbi:MAG: NUDIX domain-containing protein [Clostridiales bacterium]|nr:NUDIX domain-containing protein [Clostridiales bacterium]